MSSKITLRFAFYFLVFYMALFLVTTTVIVLLLIKLLTGFNAYSDIKEVEVWEIEKHIEEDSKGNHVFSEELIQISQKSGGVIQLIDANRKVIVSSVSNNQLPIEYSFTDLVDMSNYDESYVWSLQQDFFLLFTKQTASDLLLDSLITDESFPEITNEQKRALTNHNASFELYHADGTLLTSINSEEKVDINEFKLLESSQIFAEQKEMRTASVLGDGTIAVIRMPNPYYAPFDSTFPKVAKNFLIGFAVFHGVLFLFIIGFSIWIGQRFGRPIFHFLKRIEKLSNKDYTVVEDRKLLNAKNGRLKRKYRMYDAVDQSLIILAENLKENDLKIKNTEQLREDWITGLSHDLKTPLSSIYGYSVMLSSDHEWTIEEVQNFASVMKEKASYMDELINDLTYTYQLKNNGVLLQKERVEVWKYIMEYLRRNDVKNIRLPERGGHLYVSIDPKRFERVLDNLIENAVTHNPVNTQVHISISQAGNSVLLKVRDEGEGISIEAVENLFNRYYRGTNTTSDSTGTGLGLTIAKQLVEAHNGRIHVNSNKMGTIVVIRLPLI